MTDQVKYLEIKMAKSVMKSDSSMIRASQAPSLLPLKDVAFPSSLNVIQNALKPAMTTIPSTPSPVNARPLSPYSRRPSPPRSAPGFSKGVIDNLKKSNESLSQEVSKLQNQVKSLKQRCDSQDGEIQNLLKEAFLLSAEESSKCAAAKEIVKSILGQLKQITDKLPPEAFDSDAFKVMQTKAEAFLRRIGKSADLESENHNEAGKATWFNESPGMQVRRMGDQIVAAGTTGLSQDGGSRSSLPSTNESVPHDSSGNNTRSPETSRLMNEVEKEVSEHFEPGVWLICYQLRNGSKLFKRVKFSKRRFNEQQASEWWEANKERVLTRFAPQRSSTASASPGSSSTPVSHEENNRS